MGVAIKPCSMPNVRRGGGYRNRKPEYEQAIQDGSEDRLKALIPDNLPKEVKDIYDNAHAQ